MPQRLAQLLDPVLELLAREVAVIVVGGGAGSLVRRPHFHGALDPLAPRAIIVHAHDDTCANDTKAAPFSQRVASAASWEGGMSASIRDVSCSRLGQIDFGVYGGALVEASALLRRYFRRYATFTLLTARISRRSPTLYVQFIARSLLRTVRADTVSPVRSCTLSAICWDVVGLPDIIRAVMICSNIYFYIYVYFN